MRISALTAAALVAGVLAVTPADARVPDPTAPGRLPVQTLDYDAQFGLVEGEPLPPAYVDRLRGVVHFPGGAARRRPVVLVVPGRHDNCRVAGEDLGLVGTVMWPCPDVPPVIQDLPSWRGYDYLGRNLASHGYLVIVINTNGVNSHGALDGTRERAQLIAATLALLAEWNVAERQLPDGVGAALVGRVDLSRLGLVGHSRGADGVGRFLRDEQRTSPTSRRIKALVQIAGVDIPSGYPAPVDVPMATLLGSCDADTGNLGTAMWERRRFHSVAPRVQWLVNGANHNFFNSEWWDEWEIPFFPLPLNGQTDRACAPARPTNVRLAPADQQRIALGLLASFLRRHVGGESAFEGYLTGAVPYPTSMCPRGRVGAGRPLSCGRIVSQAYVARIADWWLLRDGVMPLRATGGVRSRACNPSSTSGNATCPEPGTNSVAPQVTLDWDRPGSVVIPAALDARRHTAVWLRVAVNPSETDRQRLDVRVVLRDARGRIATQPVGRWSTALDRQVAHPAFAEGGRLANLVLTGVRIPLRAFRGVDLRRLRSVELHMPGSGSMQLDEVLLQR